MQSGGPARLRAILTAARSPAADYSQYESEGGFVDSMSIPVQTMAQFALERKVTLTLQVPPGDSTIVIFSAIIAYPHTEA
jgi:hypothetical protein